MIVQCESCETRFHVADARIPEKGARVRCSRCHHRFHITPSSAAPEAKAPAADGSARPGARGAPDEQLDNPEFLFDDQTAQTERTARPPHALEDALAHAAHDQAPEGPDPGGRAAQARAQADQARAQAPKPVEKPAQAKPAAPEPPAPPPEPVTEERIVATGGQTAQQMLDAGAPDLGSSKAEFGGSLLGNQVGEEEEDTASRFFLGDDPSPPKSSSAPKPAKPPQPSAKPSPVLAKDAKFKDIDAAFGAGLSDEEQGDAGWESLTKDAPANVFEAGASFGLASESSSAAGDEPAKSASAFDQPDIPVASAKKRAAPGPADFDPEAGSSAAVIVRIAAALVGVALLGGAVRGLRLQREANLDTPAVEQAAGWIAADVETFVARDSTGARVLVVRGNLFPDGAAPPPEVEVSLLETDGARVGEPSRAWLQRLDDAEIAPDRLAIRLASNAGELSGTGPQVTGFTALLPDPPARARRISIALSAGKAALRGTAIAVNPPPAAPAPAPQLAPAPAPVPPPAPPTATASEASPKPPAPIARPKVAPVPEEVVPAAPAPE